MITRRTLTKSLAATPVVAMTLQAGVSGSLWQGAGAQEGPVRIGSKDFTEQLILGEMYALLLENAGITDRNAAQPRGHASRPGSASGRRDRSLPGIHRHGTVVLGIRSKASPRRRLARVKPRASTSRSTHRLRGYLEQFDLVWLDESAFNNTQALAVKRAFAEEHGLSTISELAEIAGELTIVAPSDFVERPDGLQGLEDFYGMRSATSSAWRRASVIRHWRRTRRRWCSPSAPMARSPVSISCCSRTTRVSGRHITWRPSSATRR